MQLERGVVSDVAGLVKIQLQLLRKQSLKRMVLKGQFTPLT